MNMLSNLIHGLFSSKDCPCLITSLVEFLKYPYLKIILAYKWTCSEILGSIVLPPSPLTTALDVWQLNIRRLELLRRILLDWEDAEVDVIIGLSMCFLIQTLRYS